MRPYQPQPSWGPDSLQLSSFHRQFLERAHPELFPVAGTYGLQDWREAIAAVERPGREGFILLALHSS